jgi:hypothetical protein
VSPNFNTFAAFAAVLGGCAGLVGGAIAMYFRSSASGLSQRLAALEARLDESRSEIRRNREDCHGANHDTRSLVSELSARLTLADLKAGRRVDLAG